MQPAFRPDRIGNGERVEQVRERTTGEPSGIQNLAHALRTPKFGKLARFGIFTIPHGRPSEFDVFD